MKLPMKGIAASICLCSSLFVTSAAQAADVCFPYFDTIDPPEVNTLSFSKVTEIEPLTPGFAILEGPLWVEDGLLMSHIGYATDENPNPGDLVVYRNGEVSVLQKGYQSNGLTLDQDGYVVAARHGDGTITRVINGKIEAGEFDGARFNSPNDLVYSSEGDLYFTDPSWQNPSPTQTAERAYFVKDNGKVYSFGANIEKPNGVMLSFDESSLYVGGSNGLFKFELRSNGSVIDEPVQIAGETITADVDGMSRDCAGNLYVVAGGQVHVLDGFTDTVLASYPIEGATNVAFGGPDGTTIYVTTLGAKPQLWKASSEIPGLPY